MAVADNSAEHRQSGSAGVASFASRSALPLYALTLFLSAFLLFSVQPFFAKMVLPRLGGSPAVWSVAMVFFQAVLLAGYAYAHVLTRFLGLGRAALVHALVLVLAFVVLPIAIPAGWETPPNDGQAFWLIGLFTVSVGLPFFAVSANGPLLQAWFARTGHPHAADPYFLYGSSNIGSFASLILYIVLIEPLATVGEQSSMWTAGFALLALLVAACALAAVGGRSANGHTLAASADEAEDAGNWSPAKWALLGFVPSGLLVAVTAHISLDVAAAPFLWVMPLALFLLTFVIVFRLKPLVTPATTGRLVPIFAAIAVVSIFGHNLLPVWANLAAHLVFYFVAALHCHGLLFEARPRASGLTAFYLWMSLGGVLGGVFASLLAPLLFDWVAEYILLILAVLVIRPGFRSLPRTEVATVVSMTIVATIALSLFTPASDLSTAGIVAFAIIVTVAGGALAQLFTQRAYLVSLALLLPLFFLHAELDRGVMRERSFFGVTRVLATPESDFHLMMHGTTLHGAVDLTTGSDGQPEPLTYYHESGGMAAAVRAMQARRGGALARAGAVGLGTGSVLCHAMPGEQWVAFEIDAAVVDAARNPDYFPFMSECAADVPVVLGDARLTLADQPSGGFDFLLIDAFSSDSIPAHLMTREAVKLYRSKLKTDGLLVFHISNRYLELQSVLAAIAEEEGLLMRAGVFGDGQATIDDRFILASHVAVMAADETHFGQLLDDPRWRVAEPGETRAWTDDYSNIFTALLRKL